MGFPDHCGLKLHGKYRKGIKNLITDVPGVKVGHVTIQRENVNTGVTAVLPHGGNLFQNKVMAGVSVLNGFGKSVGLVQIEELGTIEAPIIMTNTLSVGTALTALVGYMLAQNGDIGVTTSTVNCVVTECNDGSLNDIRGMHVTEKDVLSAIENAADTFAEGAVGGGTGMSCLGFKGGIGSASRVIDIDGGNYTIGAIVMSNFGSPGNLVIDGERVGRRISDSMGAAGDLGSIIIILATDIPLSDRQLKRVAKRMSIPLGRTGSYMGNGSGDIAIAFSTANILPHYSEKSILDIKVFFDEKLDAVFEAAAEAAEEAIISSLYHAKTTAGMGRTRRSLADFL